jgi:hypothetical protein
MQRVQAQGLAVIKDKVLITVGCPFPSTLICEGNTWQLYCVPNSEKSHSYMSIERVLRG